MQKFIQAKHWLVLAVACILTAGTLLAQSRPAAVAPSGQEVGETQQQFLKLLRSSPTLTTVLAHDPTLLNDQAYVTRNNPELERFLATHPEVAQNPDFYLFSKVGPGRRDQALAREVWPELVPAPREEGQFREILVQLQPILILPAFFFALVWMIRLFVDGRRWSRTFRAQSDVHAKLIDRFGSSQELVAYMGTEAGRKFLEASPIPANSGQSTPMPNVLARILTPLQVGLVLSMLGAGMLLVRNASLDTQVPMQVMGALLLMPGLGFILSAGVTWVLAKRLGLMPTAPAQQSPDARFDERNEQ